MNGYRNEAPDVEGWWYFLEDGEEEPKKLFIVEGKATKEVANDHKLVEALSDKLNKASIDADYDTKNFWEATPCEDMQGLWKKVVENEH